jgi:inner membrane protein
MPSIFTHAAVALSVGTCFYPSIPKQALAIGAVCSAIPDLDVIGFSFGVHYGDFLGHRGFTHSLLFAVLLAIAATLLFGDRNGPGRGVFLLWTYLFLATASHGFLDAMTDGGLGVAFFAPFSMTRYFLPERAFLDLDSGRLVGDRRLDRATPKLALDRWRTGGQGQLRRGTPGRTGVDQVQTNHFGGAARGSESRSQGCRLARVRAFSKRNRVPIAKYAKIESTSTTPWLFS